MSHRKIYNKFLNFYRSKLGEIVLLSKRSFNFFFEKSGKIVIMFGKLVVLCVTIYGLLYTVYSDNIVQSDSDRFFSPYKSKKETVETTLEDLICIENDEKKIKTSKSQIEEHNNFYIFVLDISGSTLERNTPEWLVDSYYRRFRKVDRYFRYGLKTNTKGYPKTLNYAKLRLYEFLVAFYRKIEIFEKDEFTIWTLGAEGRRIYPGDERRAVLADSSIAEAIRKLNELEQRRRPEQTTDFLDLFKQLQYSYSSELNKRQDNILEEPNIIITFISDLLHDVDNKKKIEIESNWEKLDKEVEQLCNSKIIVNLIMLSETDMERRRSIYPVFRNKIEWHRLNKTLLSDENDTDLLYSVKFSDKNIIFFHTDPYYIKDANFYIRSTSNTEEEHVKMSILGEDNRIITPRMNLNCKIINSEQEEKVFSGGGCFEATVKPTQRIQLTYSNRIPPDSLAPILKLSVDNRKTSFLVPIQFIKRLPKWAADIFIFLQHLIKICLIIIIAFGVLFLLRKKKEKSTEDIKRNPGRLYYNECIVSGFITKVKESLGSFNLNDGIGDIWIHSKKSIPSVGMKVRICGKLEKDLYIEDEGAKVDYYIELDQITLL